MLKKILATVVAISILLPNVGFATEKVRIGVGEMPPYLSERLEGYGFLARIVTESFALSDIETEFYFVPWNRAIENTKMGLLDGTPGWFSTPERERDFHVSSALVNDTQSFFHLKTFDFDWSSLEDLKGIAIGATLGFSYGDIFDRAFNDGSLEIDWISDDLQNFYKLLAGRISLFPMNTLTGLDMIAKEIPSDLASKITYHPRPLRSEPLRLLISRSTPRQGELLDKFNSGLAELHKIGRYGELMEAYSIDPALTVAPTTHGIHEVVVYGDDGYPPYSYLKGEEMRGIYVDILREAFELMEGYQVEIKGLPWKRLIRDLEKGKILAGFPPYRSEARPWMVYSEPILEEKVVVFGLKSRMEGRTRWPEDFYGLKVGLNDGFLHDALLGPEAARAVADGQLSVEEAFDSSTNLKKLAIGRIDVYVNDRLTDISDFTSAKDPVVIAADVVGQWGYLGFSSANDDFPYSDHFRRTFDGIIRDMRDSGRIEAIIREYTADREGNHEKNL